VLDTIKTDTDKGLYIGLRRLAYKSMITKPFPFQYKAIYGIEKAKGRVLLAYEMGTGKTLISLAWSAIRAKDRPVLIVCPASLKFNWEDEIAKHLGKECVVISGTKTYALPKSEYYIINYDILEAWRKHIIQKVKPKILIYDESHFLKSAKAKRTKAAGSIGRSVPHVLCLTGTPVENKPVELYPTLSMLKEPKFNSFWKFAQRYCGAKRVYGRWDFNGSSNRKELHDILTSEVMLRKKKSEVMKDLPPKFRSIISLEVPMREYREAEDDIVSWLKKKDKIAKDKTVQAEALVKIGHLKRLSAELKRDSAIKWVREHLEAGDNKIILFCVHHEMVDAIRAEFAKECVVITGKTSQKDRKVAKDRFQTDDRVKVFIGTIKASGVGLTLTAANSVAFLELGWTPGEHIQGEDRASRYGQTKNVNCYYLVAQGTIEHDICKLIQAKQAIIEEVIDGNDEIADWNMYSELIKKLKEKKRG